MSAEILPLLTPCRMAVGHEVEVAAGWQEGERGRIMAFAPSTGAAVVQLAGNALQQVINLDRLRLLPAGSLDRARFAAAAAPAATGREPLGAA